MVLKYYVFLNLPTFTEDVVAKVYEAQAPSAEVYSQTIAQDGGGGFTNRTELVTVNGLDKVVHIVRLYSAVSSALLHQFNVEPKTDIVTVFMPIIFRIGDGGANTPAANASVYSNSALDNLTGADYVVRRNGVGTLIEGYHYSNNGGSSGGFTLAALDTFADNEIFEINQLPKVVTTVVNDSVVGKHYGGFLTVSSNTNYDASHLRKFIRLQGDGVIYTFPLATSVPIGYIHHFNSVGAYAAVTDKCSVEFLNGPLLWGNTTKTIIELPIYTQAGFTWDGTNWNVEYLVDARYYENIIPAPAAGDILGVGSFNIGDLPPSYPYAVTHNKNIVGDYMVLGSIKTNNSIQDRDNTITWAWWHHVSDKPNKFNITLQEIYPEVQNIEFAYILVKT